MIETHDCLWCQKTIPRVTRFCCEKCQREYNKRSTTAVGMANWDYVEKHRPGARLKYILASTVVVCSVLTLNFLTTIKVINMGVFVTLAIVIMVVYVVYVTRITRVR